MRGVDVGMRLVSAGRATEDTPLADARKPAPGASPTGVGRVDLGHEQAANLRFVLDGSTNSRREVWWTSHVSRFCGITYRARRR